MTIQPRIYDLCHGLELALGIAVQTAAKRFSTFPGYFQHRRQRSSVPVYSYCDHASRLSIYLFVRRISQKVIDGFEPHFWKGRHWANKEVIKFGG